VPTARPATCSPSAGRLPSTGPSAEHADCIAAYHRLLQHPDPAGHGPLRAVAWEATTINLLEKPDLVTRFSDPAFALALARIENHYLRCTAGGTPRGCSSSEHPLFEGIPGAIVQGRYDVL